MKLRLGRGAAFAAGAVATSLFILLCMMFYGKQDYLSPERILARGDALRFRIATLFVEPFGAGAYLAFGIAFAWSIVAYFRESVGAVLPRVVGVAACIPSFCALTSLVSSPHEFWAGSVGVWTGDLVHRGFGPVLGIGVLGTLFLVSFAMATQFGFYTQFASLRGSLSFPLLPPEEAGTAVLEPGAAEPVESWKAPESSVEPAEAPAEEPEEFSDARVLDREEHVADVRRRLEAGEPVTEAEAKLVADAADQAAVGDAINSLFAPPALRMPDVPPFLLAPSAPPLLSQEIASDAPALPPVGIEASAPIPAPEEAAAPPKLATEEFDAIEVPLLVPERAPHIFSSVEFLPPNEELADPYAPAPAPEPEAPEPEIPAPAAAEASVETAASPAPAAGAAPGITADPYEDEFFAFGFEDEAPAPVAEEPAPIVEFPVPAIETPAVEVPAVVADAPAPAEEDHGAASALVMTAALPEALPAEVPAALFTAAAPAAPEAIAVPAPESAADAHGAAVEAVFPSPAADDGSWLLAAAKDLGLENVEEEVVPYAFPALEPTPDREPHTETNPCIEVHPFETLPPSDSHPDEVLARLFGDPVVRTGADTSVPGPAQSEPREPPANLMPVIEEVAERVTLLSDPAVSDCLTDHGIDLSSIEEVVVAPNEVVVDDDGPTTEDLSDEETADAIVASFGNLFSEPAAAPEEPEALEAHGWGTLFPAMFPEGTQAAAEDHQAPDDGSRTPAHAPPPVMDAVEVSVEAPVEAPVEPPMEEMVEVPPVEVLDSVHSAPAEEEVEEKVDEALVSRLVEELKSESPAAPAAEPEVEVVPSVVLPEPPATPVKREGRDELYDQAVAAVRERGRGSVVVLQRKLGIGFTRATRIVEELVADGVLGPENSSGSHPIL